LDRSTFYLFEPTLPLPLPRELLVGTPIINHIKSVMQLDVSREVFGKKEIPMRRLARARHVRLAAVGCVWMIIGLICNIPAIPASTEGRGSLVDIPVRKVVLFSSGVGYFEHMGSIAGNSSTELRFKTSQINDILKSLVLQDLDGGKVGSVVYPSQDPLAKTLRSFQVDLSKNPSLAELLTQIRGSQVKVTIQAELLQGTVLGIEKNQKMLNEKEQIVEMWSLNLIAGGTIRSVPLNEVQGIELDDMQLQEELHKALLALAQARDQAKKPVLITFEGTGERRVRVGYIVETPIWKTSYRLLLPEKLEEPAKLQGWAIVENQTDNDWNDAQLALVSGRPISFVQELYAPLYLPRPVVKPELYAGLRPQTYASGLEPPASKTVQPPMPPPPPPPPPPPGMRALPGGIRSQEPLSATELRTESTDQPLDPTAGVVAAASAGQVGELFQYSVGHVSLPRQRSAMLPIITDDIVAERLSIYNRSVLAQHPLNGAHLKNTTGKHLLQGPITVLDGHTYGGDAHIDNLPPGQERLVSYAIDLQVHVNATKQRQESRVQTAKVVKGLLQLTRKDGFTQEYIIENKADRDKVLIIEHPFRAGWKLVDSPNPVETTNTWYRFRESISAGDTKTLMVQEEIVLGETIAILPSDLGQLEFYSRMGEIPKPVRDALMKAMSLKSAMVDTERQIKERQQQLVEITQEQQRIRENMASVSQTSQYYTRLLSKLNDQETAIERFQSEVEQLKHIYDRQRQELETYLLNTTIG
jgi:hypothetical protein